MAAIIYSQPIKSQRQIVSNKWVNIPLGVIGSVEITFYCMYIGQS